jgi:hypothetical protein
MIKKGSLVRRLPDSRMQHCTQSAFVQYPPEGAVCMVLESPRKRDLQYQVRSQPGTSANFTQLSLKSAIDVLYEGRVFTECEAAVFEEVKRHEYDRKNQGN